MGSAQSGNGEAQAKVSFWSTHSNRILGASALGILALGTVAYRILEDWSWVDSFYFCAVAVTTVGFGDLTPSTDASKLFTVFYVFSGLTIISVWLNSRFKHHAAKAVVSRTGPATDASDSPGSGP